MKADQKLYDAAGQLIERRLPEAEWATAAALYLDDGSIATRVCLDIFNSAAGLCAEAGPVCHAYTTDRDVLASICVNWVRDRAKDLVLAPCGVYQERLALWGPDVEVGVADPDGAGWSSRPLHELNPHYWASVLSEDGGWSSRNEHAS